MFYILYKFAALIYKYAVCTSQAVVLSIINKISFEISAIFDYI